MAAALKAIETNDNDAPGTDIMVAVNDNPGLVLLDRRRFEQFYEAIKAETDKLVPDLTTEKGRAAIASMAFKVAKTKTAIDAAGKLLNEEARAKINVVDAARRDIRDRLDALKDEVRKPLTEWEANEAARVTQVEEFFTNLRQAGVVAVEETGEQVERRLSSVRAHGLVEDFELALFGDRIGEARILRGDVIDMLERALERIRREEADRAELERLRAEAAERAEREQAEAEARAAAEAAERQRAETERRAAEEAEAALARIAAAAKAAEDATRAAVEAKAEEDRHAQQRAHDEALAAEKRRADDAEAARKASEAQALAAQQAAEREAQAQRKADEARAADRDHRGKVMAAAKQAIMGHGVGEATAKAIVLAIAAGEVPAVSIRF